MVTGTRLTRGGFRKVPGEHYGTPKEVWGFRTAAARGSPIVIARRFLAANGELFQLEPDLGGLQLRRVIRSLGAAHVIMQQVHAGHRVHRGYVSVHIDRSGRVFLAKNRAMPRRLLPDAFEQRIDRDEAVRRARRSLPERDRRAALRETELLWFPREQTLVPAWKVRLTRRAPRDEWIVYLSARNGAILNRYDNLAEAAVGRAQVFDPSPVTTLGDHALLLFPNRRPRRPPPVAYREVALHGLDGSGRLSGEKVTTALTAGRVRRRDLGFALLSHERGFEEVKEQRLLLTIISRIASRELSGPIEREPEAFQLLTHRADVRPGPFAGVDFALHRRIFGRHAKGVPAHRVQHFIALHAPIARDHVPHRVVADVPHVDAPRGIGKHLEHVGLGLVAIAVGAERARLVPSCLPAAIGRLRVEAPVAHGAGLSPDG